MTNNLMKKSAVFVTLMFLLATAAFAADMDMSSSTAESSATTEDSTAQSGMDMDGAQETQEESQTADYEVSIAFENDTVKTGSNEFTLTVKDSDGQPVTGAAVLVTFDMDRSSMDSMDMSDPLEVTLTEAGGGEYTGTVELSDEGDWIADAEIVSGDTTYAQQLTFEVESAGPNMIVIGGFLGAIALIIVIAFLLKRKNAKQ
ncbi:MAG: hypothetical protein H6Q60_1443 [Oscillospiraceae bacterium]|nr:hypothetical protein [Oscillospiraceae bacterium]